MPDTRGAVVRPVVTGPFDAGVSLIQSITATTYFSPNQPLPTQAPPGTPPRTWDYPIGENLRFIPRGEEEITFRHLRDLVQVSDLVATLIETRKDQVAGVPWTIRPLKNPGEKGSEYKKRVASDPRAAQATARMRKPDGVHGWQTWIRTAIDDLLVIDALTILPTPGPDGVRLDLMDGATIKPLIDETGRRPTPPSKAYQQIIKGVVTSDFTTDQLIYAPRVWRTHKLYGFSPVEQCIVSINLALRRELYKLNFYTEGNIPEAIAQLPDTWPAEKIKQFEEWFNSVLSGQTAERRKMRFIPSIGGKDAISYTKQEAMKDDGWDETVVRLVCFAFSISPQPFIREMNRATAQTAQEAAKAEGLQPLLDWLAETLTAVIQGPLGYPGLEWSWQTDTVADPVQRATMQALQIEKGIKSPDQIAEDNGDDPPGVGPGIVTANGFVEFSMMKQQQEKALAAPAPGERTDPDEIDEEHPDIEKRAGRLVRTRTTIARFLERQGAEAADRLALAYAKPPAQLPATAGASGDQVIAFQVKAPEIHFDLERLGTSIGKALADALADAPTPIVHVRGGDTHVAAPQVHVAAAKTPSVTVDVSPTPVHVTPEVTLKVPKVRKRITRDADGKIKSIDSEST